MSSLKSSAFVPHDIAAPIAGRADGPLAGLTFAVKDMFAVTGQRAGGGNPDWLSHQAIATHTSSVVATLLDAGASLTGKTVCDEFFFSIAGANAHYGTPPNHRAPGRIPGGSSSGSASAVAAGAVDFALGSDTGGSVRVPAAFCSLHGIRPTHGALPMDGVLPMAPSFDVIGWFAAGPGLLRLIGRHLLPVSAPAPITRLLAATDMLALADAPIAQAIARILARLDTTPTQLAPAGTEAWREAFRVIQGREIWACHGEFISSVKPAFGPGVAERMAYAATVNQPQADAATAIRDTARAHLLALIPPGTAIMLPTAPCAPPLADADAMSLDHFRTRAMALTCAAGLAGLPQVTLPIATSDGLPAGLSLLGSPGSDHALLDLACSLAPLCGT